MTTRASYPPGTIISMDNEEHRIERYTRRGSHVVLRRALGWDITVSTAYMLAFMHPLDDSTFTFEKARRVLGKAPS